MQCTAQSELKDICPSMWQCLGDKACSQALQCWSKPLDTCSHSVWHMLTDDIQRARIEKTAACTRSCGQNKSNDFVDGIFCLLDQCSQDLLECWKDDECKAAVKCMPEV